MLRYSKTLSLALLISIPAIAMENDNQDNNNHLALVETSGTYQNQAYEEYAPDLSQTVLMTDALDQQHAQVIALAKQRKELEEQETKAREACNKTLLELQEKKKAKELAISGAKTLAATKANQLLALEKEKEQKTKDLEDEAKKAAAKIAAETATKLATYKAESEKQAKELTAQQQKALKDQQEHEKALETIKAKLEMAKKPAPAKKGWGLWPFSS